MGNVLEKAKQEQVITLGRLGWSLRRSRRRHLHLVYLFQVALDLARIMPRAYNDKILSSKPANRVWPLATSFGSKLACRSRGTSICISPKSPFSCLVLTPLVAAATCRCYGLPGSASHIPGAWSAPPAALAPRWPGSTASAVRSPRSNPLASANLPAACRSTPCPSP